MRSLPILYASPDVSTRNSPVNDFHPLTFRRTHFHHVTMRVVHLAITPLAGSPWRLCRALRQHTGTDARLITRDPAPYGPRTYPTDLVWSDSRHEAAALLDSADLIILHNHVGPEYDHFPGLRLDRLHRAGKSMLRQFHSPADFVARHGPWPSAHAMLSPGPFPQLVIAQAQERMYPFATPVPNIVPVNDSECLPRADTQCDHSGTSSDDTRPIRICFSPTSRAAAAEDRWSTKGRDETLAILHAVAEKNSTNSVPVEIDLIEDTPYAETLARRRAADIAIDEVVTGNVHLSSFESLAMGLPTIAHVDDRLDSFLREFTGCDSLPWVTATLSTLEETLLHLIRNPTARRSASLAGRDWMLEYWSDSRAAQLHLDVYQRALAGSLDTRPRFDLSIYNDWWDIIGRVEVRRLDDQPQLTTPDTRAHWRTTSAAALSVFHRALEINSATSTTFPPTIAIISDHPGDLLNSLRAVPLAAGCNITDVRCNGSAIPPALSSLRADIIITHDTLIHRPPADVRAFLAATRRAATRAIILIERADPALPVSQFFLDPLGGWWNHDWRNLVPTTVPLVAAIGGENRCPSPQTTPAQPAKSDLFVSIWAV